MDMDINKGGSEIEASDNCVWLYMPSGVCVRVHEVNTTIFTTVFHNKENKDIEFSYRKGVKVDLQPF